MKTERNATQIASMDKYGFPADAPAAQVEPPKAVVPWEFGIKQGIRARQIKVSQINIKNPGTVSNVATATGTIQAGSTLFVVDTLTPQSPHGTEMNYAIPYVAVYEGTTNNTANQIYPVIGGNKTWGSYSFMADCDWDKFANTTPGSVISTFNLTIHNNMGAAGTFFYVSAWKYLNLNSGTVT